MLCPSSTCRPSPRRWSMTADRSCSRACGCASVPRAPPLGPSRGSGPPGVRSLLAPRHAYSHLCGPTTSGNSADWPRGDRRDLTPTVLDPNRSQTPTVLTPTVPPTANRSQQQGQRPRHRTPATNQPRTDQAGKAESDQPHAALIIARMPPSAGQAATDRIACTSSSTPYRRSRGRWRRAETCTPDRAWHRRARA